MTDTHEKSSSKGHLATGQHISGRFNEELEGIKSMLLEMGGKVEQQIDLTAQALADGESEAADAVIVIDREINQLEVEIDEQCARIIALRQPAAFDLRLVMSIAKLSTDLERIGDEATRVAKIANTSLSNRPLAVSASHIIGVANEVSGMLRQALDAFARLDAETAIAVVLWDRDANGDFNAGMAQLKAAIQADVANLDFYMDRIWALRSLQRVGSHGVNIAEQVVYLVTGNDIRHLDDARLRTLVP